eukprot:3047184-Karenia_brevis.AAC.1
MGEVPMEYILQFTELYDQASDDNNGQFAQMMLEDKSAFNWARPPWDTKHDEAHIVDNIPRADAPNIYE